MNIVNIARIKRIAISICALAFVSVVSVVVMLMLATTFAVHARTANSKQPIEITADELEILQPNRKAIFRGNVIAKQGDVTIQSRSMTVYYRTAQERRGDMGAVSKIEVDGDVLFKTPQESARGNKGVYNVDQKQILLLGNVILSRGQNVLRGDRLDYNLVTQKSLLTSIPITSNGGKSRGRVKGVFVPNK